MSQDQNFQNLQTQLSSKAYHFPEKLWMILHFVEENPTRKLTCGIFWASDDVICYNKKSLSQTFQTSGSNIQKSFSYYKFASEKDILLKIQSLKKPENSWRFTFSVNFPFNKNTTHEQSQKIKNYSELPDDIEEKLREKKIVKNGIEQIGKLVNQKKDENLVQSLLFHLEYLLNHWPDSPNTSLGYLASKLFGKENLAYVLELVVFQKATDNPSKHQVSFLNFFEKFVRYGSGSFLRQLFNFEPPPSIKPGFSYDEKLYHVRNRLKKSDKKWVIAPDDDDLHSFHFYFKSVDKMKDIHFWIVKHQDGEKFQNYANSLASTGPLKIEFLLESSGCNPEDGLPPVDNVPVESMCFENTQNETQEEQKIEKASDRTNSEQINHNDEFIHADEASDVPPSEHSDGELTSHPLDFSKLIN